MELLGTSYYFNAEFLGLVKTRIKKAPQFKLKNNLGSKKASILLPILNVKDRGSILYTLRSGQLSLHKNEGNKWLHISM